MIKYFRSHKRQVGISLAIALVVLLIVTILTVTSVRSSVLQTKIYVSFMDKELSFQGAESGIREAENWLVSLSVAPSVVNSCGTQVCTIGVRKNFYYDTQNDAWWSANAATFTKGNLTKITDPPRYVIEFLQFTPDTVNIGHANSSGLYLYQITARSSGSSANVHSVVQTTFARRF